MNETSITGCILGTAIGDALGLPYEGISRERQSRLLGSPNRYRFFLGRGMFSDDTEHTCLVAQAMISTHTDVDAFAKNLANRMRWWSATLPAGIGRATLRACFKLWLGYSPKNAGVFSAGNGPSMRSALLGIAFDDINTVVKHVRVASRLTHTDPKAEFGAIAVALASKHSCGSDPVNASQYLQELESLIAPEGKELIELIDGAIKSVRQGNSTQDFAILMGLEKGVTGYTYHTVPVAIHAWLAHPQDFQAAITSVILCGGDADTTAAIVGGIVGSRVGEAGIPDQWLSGICDWPLTVDWLRQLSKQLSQVLDTGFSERPTTIGFVPTVFRNIAFLGIVLLHGFRRLFPPY